MKNLKRWLVMMLMLASPAMLRADEPEVEKHEVLRRGNHVEYIDGYRSHAGDAFEQVMGPPADDNHKWFITVVTTKGCAPCARLKADLASDPHLRALVNVSDPKMTNVSRFQLGFAP